MKIVFEKLFFSDEDTVDGRLNEGNNSSFLYLSGVLWTEPEGLKLVKKVLKRSLYTRYMYKTPDIPEDYY